MNSVIPWHPYKINTLAVQKFNASKALIWMFK